MPSRSPLTELKKSQTILNVGEGLLLRPIDVSDVSQDYVDGLNDPLVRRYLGASSKQMQTFQSVEDYVRQNHECENSILYGIFVNSSLAGTVRFHDIDEDSHSAFVGIALFNKDVWGKGVGRKALTETCKSLTRILAIREFRAIIDSLNEASKKIFSIVGFKEDPQQEKLWILRGENLCIQKVN